ncbi:rhamnose biosynthetic enzyme, putative, partial [Medicago truncatula]
MHFAAQTHVDNSYENSFEFTQTSFMELMSFRSLQVSKNQVKGFIHVSTDKFYGETDENAVVGNHEASQLLETNPYSAMKIGAEMLVISYLYCEDVVEAFEIILHKGEVGHVYNIGTKKERKVIDVAKDIFVTSVTRNNYLSPQKALFKFLIYGGTWWIGGFLGNVWEKQGIELEYGIGYFEDRSELLVDIRTIKSTHVFNASGVIGELNVKWFEDHKSETIRPIVVGVLTLADVCRERVSFRSIMPLVV